MIDSTVHTNAPEVVDALQARKWRWSRRKGCWYRCRSRSTDPTARTNDDAVFLNFVHQFLSDEQKHEFCVEEHAARRPFTAQRPSPTRRIASVPFVFFASPWSFPFTRSVRSGSSWINTMILGQLTSILGRPRGLRPVASAFTPFQGTSGPLSMCVGAMSAN